MPSPVYNNYANIITFSRGTNATLTDSTGKITYAPANLVQQSQTFENAYWTKNNTTVSSDVVATTAPDGTNTADKLAETTATNIHSITSSVITTPEATTIFSIYAKAAERSYIALYWPGGSKGKFFNLSNGTVGGNLVGAPTSANIQSVGNGWYRCSIIFTATTSTQVECYLSTDGTTFNYTGTAGSGVYIWGAQLEPVTYQTTPSTYVATTTAAYYGPRLDYDPVTLAVKGLLVEEARTNLLTYSEQFDNGVWGKNQITVSADATLSPAGTLTADKIIPQAIAGAHSTYNTYTYAAAAYTLSVYAKPAGYSWIKLGSMFTGNGVYFDISNGVVGSANSGYTGTITPAANGFYRCQVTWTASAGSDNPGFYVATANNTNTFTGDGTSGVFAWGMQVEAGAFATSYIPTTTASVARSADVASLSGTNFSSWYNPNAGTLVGVGTTFNASGGTFLFNMMDSSGTSANEYSMYQTGTAPVWLGNSGAVNQFTITPAGSVTNNTPFKLAGTYSANDFAAAFNNGAVATDTSGATATGQDRAWVGARNGATNFANGHIQTITYYPRRLSNSQLQSLTS